MKNFIISGLCATVANVLMEVVSGCAPVQKDIFMTHFILLWILANQFFRQDFESKYEEKGENQ